MKLNYQNKIDAMMANYENIKKAFKWEGDLSKHLVALNYATQNKTLNIEALKDVKDHMKQETSAFSVFRGTTMFSLCGLVTASSDEPKVLINQMLQNKDIMKSVGFRSSTFLPTAMYALSTVYKGNDVEGYGMKAMSIYKEMRSNHPLLTSGDDYALAILFASTNRNPDILETYYKALTEVGFQKTNGLQMLSHIMSFSNKDVQSAVMKCKKIYEKLKENKLKISYDYYPAIGLISLLEDEDDEITNDLIEVATYLRNQKKYKWLGKGMNILMASAIITSDYITGSNQDVATTSMQISIQTIIAAQQAAMIAAVSASTAATSAT